MKRTIAILLALSLALACFGCTQPEEEGPEYLVKEMTVTSGGQIQRMVYEYDENWNESKIQSYEGDVLTETVVYEYDDKGNVAKETHTDADGVETVKLYANTCDDAGNLIQVEVTENGVVVQTQALRYDDDGNCIETETVVTDSYGVTTTVNTFTESGKLLSTHVTTEMDGEVTESSGVLTYNDDENVIEQVSVYPAGRMKTVTEYNSDGKMSKVSVYSGEEETLAYYTEYTYEDLLVAGIQYTADGTKTSTILDTMDEAGNLLRREYRMDDEAIQTIEYTYIEKTQ